MIGNIGETDKTIRETIRSIHKAQIGPNGIFYAQHYPGGRTWDWALERGIITDTHAYLMSVSGKDAAAGINANMTPYPNFVLTFWKHQVWLAMHHSVFFSKKDFQELITIKAKLKGFLLRILSISMYPVSRLITRIYCESVELRKKIHRTRKDKLYELAVDEDGAILPKNLIVGRPQRHMEPRNVQEALARGLIYTPIDSETKPITDDVHIRIIKN